MAAVAVLVETTGITRSLRRYRNPLLRCRHCRHRYQTSKCHKGKELRFRMKADLRPRWFDSGNSSVRLRHSVRRIWHSAIPPCPPAGPSSAERRRRMPPPPHLRWHPEFRAYLHLQPSTQPACFPETPDPSRGTSLGNERANGTIRPITHPTNNPLPMRVPPYQRASPPGNGSNPTPILNSLRQALAQEGKSPSSSSVPVTSPRDNPQSIPNGSRSDHDTQPPTKAQPNNNRAPPPRPPRVFGGSSIF